MALSAGKSFLSTTSIGTANKVKFANSQVLRMYVGETIIFPSDQFSLLNIKYSSTFADVCTNVGTTVSIYWVDGSTLDVGDYVWTNSTRTTLAAVGYYGSSNGTYYYVNPAGVVSSVGTCPTPTPTPTLTPTQTVTPTRTQTPTPTTQTTLINVGYDSAQSGTACVNAQTGNYVGIYYVGSSFDTATGFYSPSYPTAATSGWYSNGTNARYWNGSSITQTVACPTPTPTPTQTPTKTSTQTPTPTQTNTPTPTKTPAAIVATLTVSNVSCNGGSNGSITVTGISGGFGGPYQTKLGVGGTYTTWTTSTVYGSLTAGTYTVYVKDSASREVTFTTSVSQPTAALTVSAYSNTPSAISITTTGGTGSRTYQLYQDTASPYNVGEGSVIATNSGVPENQSTSFTGLSSGYYWVRVTDANGCVVNSVLFTL